MRSDRTSSLGSAMRTATSLALFTAWLGQPTPGAAGRLAGRYAPAGVTFGG
ncbi:hypothetical protein [uncultured Arsenicicoccus sp.]|uniref:hypothetical protein n=1 Tax=uncultured Arsenicicoccus sp. TaxID=491339 RepID=UPI0025985F44|nr:hypothetical protein [uncultured Arsenicicoccus sp.]